MTLPTRSRPSILTLTLLAALLAPSAVSARPLLPGARAARAVRPNRGQPARARAPRVPSRLRAESPHVARLRRDVAKMSDPAVRGREPGLPEYKIIATYAAEQLRGAGIKPLGGEGEGVDRYFHPFSWKPPIWGGKGGTSVNVVGVRRGTAATNKATLVIAHLDHIEGLGGANDNASGSATLLNIARNMQPDQLQKNVIFLLSSAEEKGLVGTYAFARDEVARKAGFEIEEVLNFDMVGAGASDRFLVFGGNNAGEAAANPMYRAVTAVGQRAKLNVLPGHEHDEGERIFTRSDHYVFAQKGLATAMISSGLEGPYHSPEDTADKLNFDKLANAVDYGSQVLRAVAGSLGRGGDALVSRRPAAMGARPDALALGPSAGARPAAAPAPIRYRPTGADAHRLVELRRPDGSPSGVVMQVDPSGVQVGQFKRKVIERDGALEALRSAGRLPAGATAEVRGLSQSGRNWRVAVARADGTRSALMIDRFTGRVTGDSTPRARR